MAKKKVGRKLPCIGSWTLTRTSPPTAGNTLVGLWLEDGGERIEFFCAFYQTASGECVDPDDLLVDEAGITEPYTITYHSRQGDAAVVSDEPIDPPDYWAECRFLIPTWGDK